MFYNNIANMNSISTDTLIITGLGSGILHSDSNGNITSSLIDNIDISNTASISYSKLNLNNSITSSDLIGNIPYSKLNLNNSVTNNDLVGNIAYNKLNLNNSITNSDLAGNITYSKLTPLPTNTNTANTIVSRDASSNFNANAIGLDDSLTITKQGATTSWGARIIVRNNTLTTGKSFNLGVYNHIGIDACYIGANDGTAATTWEDCFINPNGNYATSAANVYVGFVPFTFTPIPSARNEKLNVLGGIYADSGIRLGTGAIPGSGGAINAPGAITYATDRFFTNENTIIKRTPNMRYALITSGGSISGVRDSYGITNVIKTGTGLYTVQWVSWTTNPLVMVTVENGGYTLSYTINTNTEVNVSTVDLSGTAADRTFQITVIG